MSNPNERNDMSEFSDELSDEALDRMITDTKASAGTSCATHPTRGGQP